MSQLQDGAWVEYTNDRSTVSWPAGSPEAQRRSAPRIAVTRDRLEGLARDAYFIGRGRPDVDFERWLGGRLSQLEAEDGG